MQGISQCAVWPDAMLVRLAGDMTCGQSQKCRLGMSRSAWKQICGLQGSSALWACLRDADGCLEGAGQQVAQAGALLGAKRQAEALAGARLPRPAPAAPAPRQPAAAQTLQWAQVPLISCKAQMPEVSVPDWSPHWRAMPCVQRLAAPGPQRSDCCRDAVWRV